MMAAQPAIAASPVPLTQASWSAGFAAKLGAANNSSAAAIIPPINRRMTFPYLANEGRLPQHRAAVMDRAALHRRHAIAYGSRNLAIGGHPLARVSFFKPPPKLTIGEIAALTQAQLRSEAPLDRVIADIATLDRARPSDLTFLESGKHLAALASTRAGACLVTEQFEACAP